LFMATANPATLMNIGNGVGSAVMSGSGILRHAPFLPVSGALMPVVAPLMAFQIISTVTIMSEFKLVNKKLDHIKSLIERIITREEATNLGIIISVLKRVEDIEYQYETLKCFNTDMVYRLALLENSINPLFERYNYLYSSAGDTVVTNKIEYSRFVDGVRAAGAGIFGGVPGVAMNSAHVNSRQSERTFVSKEDLTYKQWDAHLAILSSIVDIRVSLLRIKLNMQEAPEYVENSTILFKEKVSFYEKLWEMIQKENENIKEISSALEDSVKAMSWWKRKMPSWLGGKRKERKENEANIQKLSHAIDFYNTGLRGTIENCKQSVQGIGRTSEKNLLYWKDDMGEHSYFTDELDIKIVDNSKLFELY